MASLRASPAARRRPAGPLAASVGLQPMPAASLPPRPQGDPPGRHPAALHRLPDRQRRLLWLAGGLLLVSGLAWLALHYTVGAGAGELPHPLEAWSMRLHGGAAFGALFVLGTLAAAHVPQGWRLTRRQGEGGRRQRRLGLGLCVLAALLSLTGYALYYFAPESIRPALGWLHAGIGVAMAVLVAMHRRRS